MNFRYRTAVGGWLVLAVLLLAVPASADVCVAPDRGDGTIDLPAMCPYVTEDGTMDIIDGLPPGTEINSVATLHAFTGISTVNGGMLGGEMQHFDAQLLMEMTGSGSLLGFSRTLSVPVSVEMHSGPRNPGDPVQTFPIIVFNLYGELYGDPDFCELRVFAGNEFGLPSPGETELTELPGGDFDVESFFDITYRIEFTGCPGSIIDGYSGATTATTRMVQGGATWQPGDPYKMHYPQLPDTLGWDIDANYPIILGDDWRCIETGWVKDIHFWGAWREGYEAYDLGFRVSIWSDVPAGVDQPYSHPGEIVWTRDIFDYSTVLFSPLSYERWLDPLTMLPHSDSDPDYYQYDVFLGPDDWFWQEEGAVYWLSISALIIDPDPEFFRWGWKTSLDHYNDAAVWWLGTDTCVAPDRGDGTPNLPALCDFIAPDGETMNIIDGLPAGDEIRGIPVLRTFTSIVRTPGGALGGEILQFEAYLDLDMTGIGSLTGFSRHLSVPMFVEMHVAPRTPGNPVQTFPAEIYVFQGELFGDPDFCVFRVYGGSDWGLPCPGNMTLTELPTGDFAVESFFDVTYQLEFQGCPGSQLDGYAGVTTGTCRLQQGLHPGGFWAPLYNPYSAEQFDMAFVITGGIGDHCCIPPTVGDCDQSGGVDITDISVLIDNQFLTLTPLVCEEEGDVDFSGVVDITDLSILIDNQFLTLTPLPPCP